MKSLFSVIGLSLLLPALAVADDGIVLVPGQTKYELSIKRDKQGLKVFRTQDFAGKAEVLVHTASRSVCIRSVPGIPDCTESPSGIITCAGGVPECVAYRSEPDPSKDRLIELDFLGSAAMGDVENYLLSFTKKVSGVFRDKVTRDFALEVTSSATERTVTKLQGDKGSSQPWKFLIK